MKTTNSNPPPAALKPKNWLMKKFRDYHIWLGVAMSAFIVIVSITGIYLNHEDLFKGEKKPAKMTGMSGDHEHQLSGLLKTSSDLAAQPVSFASALTSAQERWGDIPIEKVELKDEHGTLVYKIKAAEDHEIIIDATTGKLVEKLGYKQLTQASSGAPMESGLNWGKIIKDMHTGKIFATPGKLLVDFTSLIIIGLTLTGVYLWGAPKWRKWKAAKAAPAIAETQPATRVKAREAEETIGV